MIAAPAVDAVCVLVFVLIGRRSHDEGNTLVEVLRTVAPFLIGQSEHGHPLVSV